MKLRINGGGVFFVKKTARKTTSLLTETRSPRHAVDPLIGKEIYPTIVSSSHFAHCVYMYMCVLSHQNVFFSIETHSFVVFFKNLSEDVIILSMPNTADAGTVAVLLFV